MRKPVLTYERLRKVLRYSRRTGEFYWLIAAGAASPNKAAGSSDGKGYLKIRVDGKAYFAHRLAWLYVTREWPKNKLDHRNGKRSDNTWRNLRLATAAQNSMNAKVQFRNRFGAKGVEKAGDRYRVRFRTAGVTHNFGVFDTLAKARGVARRAHRQLYGKFSRTTNPRAIHL